LTLQSGNSAARSCQSKGFATRRSESSSPRPSRSCAGNLRIKSLTFRKHGERGKCTWINVSPRSQPTTLAAWCRIRRVLRLRGDLTPRVRLSVKLGKRVGARALGPARMLSTGTPKSCQEDRSRARARARISAFSTGHKIGASGSNPAETETRP